MKTLAFVFGLGVATVGVIGILAPSSLVWIAQHSVTSGAFYFLAAVRVAVGLVLISAASASTRACSDRVSASAPATASRRAVASIPGSPLGRRFGASDRRRKTTCPAA